jgi:hypothetical protein
LFGKCSGILRELPNKSRKAYKQTPNHSRTNRDKMPSSENKKTGVCLK